LKRLKATIQFGSTVNNRKEEKKKSKRIQNRVTKFDGMKAKGF